VAELKSEAQHDSAAKAALPLERFCPDKSMAPVFGDCVDGGGVALKSVKADPDGEIVKFRRPGRAMLNSTWGS
jgi:hypothetical protein